MKPGEKLEIVLYDIMHTIKFLFYKKSKLVSENKSKIRPYTVPVVSAGVFGEIGRFLFSMALSELASQRSIG